ncbi:MAG: hypothetical protein ACE5HZ_08295 [Fidelibacterota bacterium]
MDACCALPGEHSHQEENTCPTCGKRGKTVSALTIRSLTRRDWRHYPDITDGYLCTNPEDSTVYFFPGSHLTVDKHHLVDRVGFKETEDPRTVCYCFRHTREEIESDFLKFGRSTVEEEIREKVDGGGCSCEVTNPSGRCCLGDVRKVYLPLKKKTAVTS